MTHLLLGLALLGVPPTIDAKDRAPDVGKVYKVPYKTTDTNHALVRVRINGKGPFNFLVDTGAPLLFLSNETAARAGIAPNKDGFYTDVDRLDFEGGPFLVAPKARVEDVFQLVGMNALGLPGATIDGILGYSILARFRIELDPTKDRMTWTRLDFEPNDLPVPADARERNAPPEVQAMNLLGPLMKFAALVIGKKPAPDLRPRGFVGLELAEADGALKVAAVVADSPAAQAGIESGDTLERVDGRAVADAKAARAAVAKLEPGATLNLTVRRGDATRTITLTAGEGL